MTPYDAPLFSPAGTTGFAMPPNILLIVLDCVRYDGLGYFGNPRPVSPRLDELATRSRCYTQARAAAVWTLESHASLFTGLYPRQHGVNAEHTFLATGIPTLAEVLSQLGYQTAAFSTNAWVGPHFGLHRGFAHFFALWRLFPRLGHLPFPLWEKALRKLVLERRDKGAAKLNRYLRRWWQQQRDPERPFFLFALYLDAHLPYRPPRGYAERLLPAATLRAARQANQDAWAYMAGQVTMTVQDFIGLRGLYDAEIAYVDACVGALLDSLAAAGGLENTVIIITADHGENIGEHGLMDHQYCVYDTLAHVPLIVHYPDAFPPGDDETPVQHTDLFPTLLDLATATMAEPPPRPPLPGRSLLSPAPDRPLQVIQYTAPQRERFIRRYPHFDMAAHGFDRTFDAIVVRGYKLIRSNRGEIELYDLEDDPAESTDLVRAQPQRVAALTAELDAWLAAHPPVGQPPATALLDKDLANHLRGLGYL